MATTDREPPGRGRVVGVALAGVLAVLAAVAAVAYFTRPPQMGPDADVFRTVDALYTAVRAKDAARLAQCEQRLHAHRAAGKLPAASAAYLDGIVARARAGEWPAATERLYAFMLAQRREGPRAAAEPPSARGAAGRK